MNIIGIRRGRLTIIRALKVDDIRWNMCNWDVIEAFIEPGMGCNFDPCGFRVTPKCVSGCVRNMTKEDTLARVGFEFGRFPAGRSDPHSAAEGAKVCEVFLSSGCQCDRRLWIQMSGGCCVAHPEGVVKCMWPEFG